MFQHRPMSSIVTLNAQGVSCVELCLSKASYCTNYMHCHICNAGFKSCWLDDVKCNAYLLDCVYRQVQQEAARLPPLATAQHAAYLTDCKGQNVASFQSSTVRTVEHEGQANNAETNHHTCQHEGVMQQ